MEDREAKRLGEAGGADGSAGDGGLGSSTASDWLLVCGTLGKAESGGAGRRGEVGGDTGALALCGEVTGRKSGLAGGDMERWRGEGGNREKGETSGELRGEDAALSSALEKMKAVSVRLRWYRLNGLPGERENSLSVVHKLKEFMCIKTHCNLCPIWIFNRWHNFPV